MSGKYKFFFLSLSLDSSFHLQQLRCEFLYLSCLYGVFAQLSYADVSVAPFGASCCHLLRNDKPLDQLVEVVTDLHSLLLGVDDGNNESRSEL